MAACRNGTYRALSGTDAERPASGIQHHDEVRLTVRLMPRGQCAKALQLLLRRVQVVNVEVEVHLHLLGALRPRRRAIVFDLPKDHVVASELDPYAVRIVTDD